MTDLNSLPTPDQASSDHSERLSAFIAEKINQAGGVITFADYMNTALYQPGLGYYMAGSAKFGADGDFVTAPETSPLFGRALAVQIAEVLQLTQGTVLELGAGSGRLALSVISALHNTPGFHYSILEPSADLAQRQEQLLRSSLPVAALDKVSWLTQLPSQFYGVIVANEVIDALPVERFCIKNNQLMQQCVTENLTVEYRKPTNELLKAVAAIEADLQQPFAEGYSSELCLLLSPWIRSLSQALERGVLLLIDYGYPRAEYYSAERHKGTLSCYYRHRMHDDPFHLPGLQDITAHVDFTAVIEAGTTSELELVGYASQSAFLLDNELLELVADAQRVMDRDSDRISLTQQIKTLTLPGEMGERFQVMALGKGYDRPLRGFRTQDLSHRL